jgi:hypothetical protein
VPSTAYLTWHGQRQGRIDQLLDAHSTMSGTGRGRRWRTEQVNWALTLRLAAEFQGYARDLHDLAVDHFVGVVSGGDLRMSNVLRVLMTKNRRLDKGNADAGALEEDFSRLGIDLRSALEQATPSAVKWRKDLSALIRARNAIAHANEGKLATLASEGYPARLTTVGSWKKTLDGLVGTMDDVVSDYLDGLLRAGRPW